MGKRKEIDVKLKVTFTEGYQQRFTAACLKQLALREAKQKAASTGAREVG